MQLVKALRKQGFTVERTGSGHWKIYNSAGEGPVVMAFSPRKSGQHRTLKRLEALGYRR